MFWNSQVIFEISQDNFRNVEAKVFWIAKKNFVRNVENCWEMAKPIYRNSKKKSKFQFCFEDSEKCYQKGAQIAKRVSQIAFFFHISKIYFENYNNRFLNSNKYVSKCCKHESGFRKVSLHCFGKKTCFEILTHILRNRRTLHIKASDIVVFVFRTKKCLQK